MPEVPGFTAINDQIFYRDPGSEGASSQPPAEHPTDLILYAWGDSLPKHLLKYTDGFRTLFPQTRQILVLGPISKALHSPLPARTLDMMPIITFLFPQPGHADSNEDKTSAEPVVVDHSDRRILTHAMSNTGGINYASTLNAYRTIYHQPLPHTLAVFDSTPGTTVMTWANLKRWSHAMSMGTAKWFPWPYVVTQTLWGTTLVLNRGWDNLVGKESAAPWSTQATYDETYSLKSTRRLYFFSKEDEIIGWEDVQGFSDRSEELGWAVDRELFVDSGHVGHMRVDPERYWGAIKTAWGKAIGITNDDSAKI